MDAKLGDAVAHRLRVAERTSFKPFDPSDHIAANRGACQTVEPRVALRKCFDVDRGSNGIELVGESFASPQLISRLSSRKAKWAYRLTPAWLARARMRAGGLRPVQP